MFSPFLHYTLVITSEYLGEMGFNGVMQERGNHFLFFLSFFLPYTNQGFIKGVGHNITFTQQFCSIQNCCVPILFHTPTIAFKCIE